MCITNYQIFTVLILCLMSFSKKKIYVSGSDNFSVFKLLLAVFLSWLYLPLFFYHSKWCCLYCMYRIHYRILRLVLIFHLSGGEKRRPYSSTSIVRICWPTIDNLLQFMPGRTHFSYSFLVWCHHKRMQI